MIITSDDITPGDIDDNISNYKEIIIVTIPITRTLLVATPMIITNNTDGNTSNYNLIILVATLMIITNNNKNITSGNTDDNYQQHRR